MRVGADRSIHPSQVAAWLDQSHIRILNIAGNRESIAPGIGQSVERFLTQLFRQLGHMPD
jgi:Circularly permutated YpsA SLOG family